MRILVLSKRQYTGKDLIDDQYGRLYEIPEELSSRGHDVIGVTLSYRVRDAGWVRCQNTKGMRWFSVNLLPTGLWRYPQQLLTIAKQFRPQVIWAVSDAFHAIFGWMLSRVLAVPLVIDLYDNFESFSASRLPGVLPIFRIACREAAGLSTVSQSLADFVINKYGVKSPIQVLGNGISEKLFYPRNRNECRRLLGLPENVKLVGTAGAITSKRGIEDLFRAFIFLAKQDFDLYLVYAGPRDSTPKNFCHPRVIDLGVLPLEKIPLVFSALDVGVVCNRNSNFGRYCFPQKLYELIACRTPLVVAALGDIPTIFAKFPDNVFEPGDYLGLAQKIQHQIINPVSLKELAVPSWYDLSVALEVFLGRVLKSQ